GGSCDERGSDSLDVGDFVMSSCSYTVADKLPAALPYRVICIRLLAADGEQFLEPALAITGMDCLVGPVEIHIVLAQGITVRMKQLSPCRLVANILGLEKVQHP